LLMSLLNSLLPLEDEIIEVEYLPAEQVPDIPLFKNSIVDVRCTDQNHRQFIVEMQMLWTNSFKYRVLFNASKAYVRQLEKGEKYRSLQSVYALSLVNETFDFASENYYHHFQIVSSEEPKMQLEGLEFVFIELTKFKAEKYALKKLGILWLRFLKEIEDGMEKISEDFEQVAELRKALECLQESAFTKKELESYDKYWDMVSQEKTLIDDAWHKGITKGEEIGHSKGLQEGKEIGHSQGLKEGEKRKAVEMAEKCLQKGMEWSDISDLTGLTLEEIKQIIQK